MKLTTIAEATRSQTPPPQNDPTFAPIDILIAAYAAMSVRGKYISASASSDQATSMDVKRLLWGIGAGNDPAAEGKMKSAMTDQSIRAQAQDALDWFTALPDDAIRRSDFFSSIKSVLAKKDINSRQAGFVCGIAAARSKDVGLAAPGQAKPKLDWPPEWGDVEVLYKKKIKIVKSHQVHSQTTGSNYVRVDIQLPTGELGTWMLANDAVLPPDGSDMVVVGFLVPDMFRTKRGLPPGIKFTPDQRWIKKLYKNLNKGTKDEDDSEAPDNE